MIQDSGERRTFETGAQRDRQVGKGRMDLLPYRALMEVSKLFEQGAIKYESRNWEKGMPVKEFLDSGARHHAKCMIGMMDEPHLVQWCWNALCALDTYLRVVEGDLPGELMDDLPFDSFRLMGEIDKDINSEPKARGPSTEQEICFTLKNQEKSKEFKEFIDKYINAAISNGQSELTVGPEPSTKPKFPTAGEYYSLFDKPWEVVRTERSNIILQCVTTGALFTASWGYWKEQYKLGNICLYEPHVGQRWKVGDIVGTIDEIENTVIIFNGSRINKYWWEAGVKSGNIRRLV